MALALASAAACKLLCRERVCSLIASAPHWPNFCRLRRCGFVFGFVVLWAGGCAVGFQRRAGVETCTPQCALGETGCNGDVVSACVMGPDGCGEWSEIARCPAAQPFCSSGACSVVCQHECGAEQTRCVGSDAVQGCGSADTDSCRDWLPVRRCASGSCRDGVCVADGVSTDGGLDPDDAARVDAGLVPADSAPVRPDSQSTDVDAGLTGPDAIVGPPDVTPGCGDCQVGSFSCSGAALMACGTTSQCRGWRAVDPCSSQCDAAACPCPAADWSRVPTGYAGDHPHLALVGDGRVAVAFASSAVGSAGVDIGDLMLGIHAPGDSRGFVAGEVPGAGSHVVNPFLIIDASVRAHIFFADLEQDQLRYATRLLDNHEVPWTFEAIDSIGDHNGAHPSVAFDDAGGMHIAYIAAAGPSVRYAYRGPAAVGWNPEIVATLEEIPVSLSLALDSGDAPRIFVAHGGSAVAYRRAAAGWDANVVAQAHWVAAARSASGEVNVAHMIRSGSGPGPVSFSRPRPDGSWETEPIGATGRNQIRYVQHAGTEHLVYTDGPGIGNLGLALKHSWRRGNGDWVHEIVDTETPSIGAVSSALVDADGTLYTAYSWARVHYASRVRCGD